MYSEGLVLPVIFLNIQKKVTNFGGWSKKTWNYSIFKDETFTLIPLSLGGRGTYLAFEIIKLVKLTLVEHNQMWALLRILIS